MERITESGTQLDWVHSKPIRLLCVCAVSMLLVLGLSGAAVFKYSVVIEDRGVKTIVLTSEEDPLKIMAAEQITLGEHDEYLYDITGENERTIRILRANRVTLHADGVDRVVYRTSGTVGEALTQLGITLGTEDRVSLSLFEPLTGDTDVVINRVTHKTVEQEIVIPFTVEKLPTQALAEGKTRTLSEGINGVTTTTTAQTLMDGVVVDEQVISEEITKQPVNSRVFVGDPKAPASQLVPDEPIALDKNGNPVNYKYKVTGKATAYSARGRATKLVPGCVAMDLADFPRYTKLYIKTPDGSYIYGYSEVRDTGTAMIEDICLVDLFFSTYRESVLFGAKTVDVYVL